MENELIPQPEQQYLSVPQIQRQVKSVKDIMKDVMVKGEVVDGKIVKDGHYSVIPGCGDKLVLLKPGAEKLCLAFNLSARYDVQIVHIPEGDVPPGHREYRVTCNLFNRATDSFVDQGVATCSTAEGKYRYRSKWEKGKYAGKEENPCIADVYNTVEKMACKRALVHAVIKATATGDMFMQDLEDFKGENTGNNKPPKKEQAGPKSKSESPPKTNNASGEKKVTSKQVSMIWGLLFSVYKDSDKDEKHRIVADILQQDELISIKELSASDASFVITELKERENG